VLSGGAGFFLDNFGWRHMVLDAIDQVLRVFDTYAQRKWLCFYEYLLLMQEEENIPG